MLLAKRLTAALGVRACCGAEQDYDDAAVNLLADSPGDGRTGQVRELGPGEKTRLARGISPAPTHVVVQPFTMSWRGSHIEVPRGRYVSLPDNSSERDGFAELVRQHLYSAHEFSCGTACSRADANAAVRRARGRTTLADLRAWLNLCWDNTKEWDNAYTGTSPAHVETGGECVYYAYPGPQVNLATVSRDFPEEGLEEPYEHEEDAEAGAKRPVPRPHTNPWKSGADGAENV
jgi:hypothetical protein